VNAWDRVWQALRLPSTGHTAPVADQLDTDFDFLAGELEGPTPLAASPLDHLSQPDSARGREIAAISAWLDAAAADLAVHWSDVLGTAALAQLDSDGTWLLCQLLARSRDVPCSGHNAVCTLLDRAITSPSQDLATAGIEAALRVSAREVQLAVAQRLARDPHGLGHEGVDRFLTFLEQHGDGRVVRTLEALLAQHGATLTDAHAWRARHIVQSIRRGGRK